MSGTFRVLLIENDPTDGHLTREMLPKVRREILVYQRTEVGFEVGRLVLLDRDDEELARANIALQAEIAKRSLAEEMLKRKTEQLDSLSCASQVMTASLDLDQVLTEFVSLAGKVATSSCASIVLVDEDGRPSRSTKDLPGVLAIEYPFGDEGLTNWIVRSRQIVVVDDIDEDGTLNPEPTNGAPRTANPRVVEAGVRSFVGLPLVIQDLLLGVLYLYSGRPSNFRDQLPLLTVFANQVAVAVGNARLFSEAQQRLDDLEQTRTQLVQSARLAAIGEWTAKVAHELNNMLTATVGYTDLLLCAPDVVERVRADLLGIRKSTDRCISLTRQLLMASRKEVLQPQTLDLNAVISGLQKILCCLLDKSIELSVVQDPTLRRVEADPRQIEQVIMNLVTNARDAMSQGGKLTIETTNIDLDKDRIRHHTDALPGHYVMLTVSDTGTGMDEETLSHIFEPFFTTKEKEKGTGLGLSTVYEIVQQNGGHIEVDSTPGRGTTFRIYLPQAQSAVERSRRTRDLRNG